MKRFYEVPQMTVSRVHLQQKIHTVSEDGLDWGDLADDTTDPGDQYAG